MRPSLREQILDGFAELVAQSPDVRIGQLMMHLGFLAEDGPGRSLWDLDDDELLAVIRRHRDELVGRSVAVPA